MQIPYYLVLYMQSALVWAYSTCTACSSRGVSPKHRSQLRGSTRSTVAAHSGAGATLSVVELLLPSACRNLHIKQYKAVHNTEYYLLF